MKPSNELFPVEEAKKFGGGGTEGGYANRKQTIFCRKRMTRELSRSEKSLKRSDSKNEIVFGKSLIYLEDFSRLSLEIMASVYEDFCEISRETSLEAFYQAMRPQLDNYGLTPKFPAEKPSLANGIYGIEQDVFNGAPVLKKYNFQSHKVEKCAGCNRKLRSKI